MSSEEIPPPQMGSLITSVRNILGLFAIFILAELWVFYALIRKASSADLTALVYGHLLLSLLIVCAFVFLAYKRSILFRETESRAITIPRELDQNPEPIPMSAFLSAPMNAFFVKDRPEKYSAMRTDMLRLVSTLKKLGFRDVFYAGESIDGKDQFDLPGAALKETFAKIQAREFFVMVWPEKFASRSELIEAGIALTLSKKCLYFVRNTGDLPYLFQGIQGVTKSVKVEVYANIDDLTAKILRNPGWITDFCGNLKVSG